MLENLIPNFKAETEWLSNIANSGYIMGFGFSYRRTEHLYNRYPLRWTQRYEENDYFFGDPVLVWTMTKIGTTRWSEIGYPDLRNIMKDASAHGLRFGATFTRKVKGKRAFLSVARRDRELTDEEMSVLEAKFNIWSLCVLIDPELLHPREVAVLILQRDGCDHAEIAARLGLSVSTVKQRQASAQKKLGAKTMASAVGIACTLQLLDPERAEVPNPSVYLDIPSS